MVKISNGWRLLFGLAVVALVVLSASCCWSSRHRQVSAEEFLTLASTPMGSAFNASFIGVTGGRAYLSVWSAMPSSISSGEDVCSCAVSALPPQTASEILDGRNPWAK
jgi:hypothetical protein